MAKVLIADDHAVVRAGLRQFLEEDRTITEIGDASTGREALDAGQPEIDRRDIGNVGECPNRYDAGQSLGDASVDRPDVAMRVSRAHHPHMQHMRKNDIGGEPAAPGHQRPVLEARNRASDEAHVTPAVGAKRHAAPRGCAAESPGARRSIRRTATVRR